MTKKILSMGFRVKNMGKLMPLLFGVKVKDDG